MKSVRKTKSKKVAKAKPKVARLNKDPRKRRGFELTVQRYDNLLNEQGGLCAVCKRPPGLRRLAADHDHKTKLVRGLLCWTCNKHIIGRHRTPGLLQAGADYLRNHLAKVAARSAA